MKFIGVQAAGSLSESHKSVFVLFFLAALLCEAAGGCQAPRETKTRPWTRAEGPFLDIADAALLVGSLHKDP